MERTVSQRAEDYWLTVFAVSCKFAAVTNMREHHMAADTTQHSFSVFGQVTGFSLQTRRKHAVQVMFALP
eukprot:SAG31_NODE_18003_length_650_cov_0.892922_2_plen_69_part_01